MSQSFEQTPSSAERLRGQEIHPTLPVQILRRAGELKKVWQNLLSSGPLRICRLFGLRDACALSGVDLLAGAVRNEDAAIVREALARLCLKAGKGGIDCLEIGAGATYGGASLYGCPWLARALSCAFPEEISIHAIDRNDSSACLLVSEDQAACLSYLPQRPALVSRLSISAGGALQAEPLPYKRARRAYGKELEAVIESARGAGGLARLYIRPAVDPILERHLFGLSVAGQTDWGMLPRLCGGRPFDFIYGRCLSTSELHEPAGGTDVSRLFSPLLKPDGGGIIESSTWFYGNYFESEIRFGVLQKESSRSAELEIGAFFPNPAEK